MIKLLLLTLFSANLFAATTPIDSAGGGSLPSQSGQAGKYLTTNGSTSSWAPVSASGGGTVTSVGSGAGLTGGPITGTGTLSVDFALVASPQYVSNAIASAPYPISSALAPLTLVGTQIQLPVATSVANGYLSSVDWTTFNTKQSALTPGSISSTTNGVTVTNGANSTVGPNVAVNIAIASSSQDGLLSSIDWSTFNAKQVSGAYITQLNGDITAVGPGFVSAALSSVGTAGTYVKVTTDAKGRVTSGSASPLGVTDGGTGQPSFVSGSIPFMSTSAFSEDNTNLKWSGYLKVKNAIELGSIDPFSRGQIWNYMTNASLRLGSLGQDGDPTDVLSEGSVFYGQNAQGDAMSSAIGDFGYARIKPMRFGLYNSKTNVAGYIFRVDPTSLYLADDSYAKTFEVTRSTGQIDTSLGLGFVHSDASGILTSSAIVPGDISGAIPVSQLAAGTNGYVVTTSGGVVVWAPSATSGTVTTVNSGSGLLGGPITSSGTLSVDFGTSPGQAVQVQAGSKLPALDGFDLTALNPASISGPILPSQISGGTAFRYASFSEDEQLESSAFASYTSTAISSEMFSLFTVPPTSISNATGLNVRTQLNSGHNINDYYSISAQPSIASDTIANFHGVSVGPSFASGSLVNNLDAFTDYTFIVDGSAISNYTSVVLSPSINQVLTNNYQGITVNPQIGNTTASHINGFSGLNFNPNFSTFSDIDNANMISINPVIQSGSVVDGFVGYNYTPSINGGNINGYRAFQVGGNFGNSNPISVNNVFDMQINPTYYSGTNLGSYVGLGIAPNFQSGMTLGNIDGFFTSLQVGSNSSNVNGISTFDTIAPTGPVTIGSYNGLSLNPNFTSSATINNYYGMTIAPNTASGVALGNVRMGYMGINNPTPVSGALMGMQIDTTNFITNIPKIGLQVSDGSTQLYSNLDTSTTTFTPFNTNNNTIGGMLHVASGFPLIASPQFGNNLGIQMIFDDDSTADNFLGAGHSLGQNIMAFANQTAVAVGKTVDTLNYVFVGGSYPAPFSTGGTVTNLAMFRAMGLINGGGSLNITNEIQFHADSAADLSGATNLWGFRSDASTADNWFNKNLVIGGSTKQPSQASGIALEIATVSGAFLNARLTTAQRNAINPLAGMQIYNSDVSYPEFYDGVTWLPMYSSGGGGGGTVTTVNSGIGLTGGPITTSGTLSVDFAQVASPQYVSNAIASIPYPVSGALSPLAISGTAVALTGIVSAPNGGTGFGSYTTGDILYASGASTFNKLAIGSTGQILSISGGVPLWVPPSAASGGADIYLSNLQAPTSITQDLIFGAGFAGILKTQDEPASNTQSISIKSGDGLNGSGDISLVTGNGLGSGVINLTTGTPDTNQSSGGLTLVTGPATGIGNSGTISLNSAGVEDGTSGGFVVTTGPATISGATGDVSITTGNSTGGNAGGITIKTGTAGATQGTIILDSQAGGSGDRGDVMVNAYRLFLQYAHITFSNASTPPTAVVNANAGTSATCTVNSSSDDNAGQITLVTGAAATASGSQCLMTFHRVWAASQVICTLSPVDAGAGVAPSTTLPFFPATTTDLDLQFGIAAVGANTYTWNYHCMGLN